MTLDVNDVALAELCEVDVCPFDEYMGITCGACPYAHGTTDNARHEPFNFMRFVDSVFRPNV
jgi:hypothetical protein